MILYKKDSKGKIRTLEIYTIEGTLYQKSGLQDGKKVEHAKECKPKNLGKSNETTPGSQAILEAAALRTKKLREGYFNTVEDAEESNVVLPMLAKDYFKEKHKLEGKKLALQPKLDGIRCNIHCDIKNDTIKAFSRKNKEIVNIDHILDELSKYLQHYYGMYDTLIFDGELFLHNTTFQEVTKLVKNKPGEVKVEYHIYDIIDANMTFKERDTRVGYLMFGSKLNYVFGVNTNMEITKDLDEYYKEYIDDGYEGMMVRVLDSPYKVNGRSSDLLKYKKFIDVALPIEDITPNDANPSHGTVWVKFNDKLQKTGAKLSHADREDLLTNKDDYIGKTAEIRYFEETDEGLMRFPVYHGIRIDK